MAQPIDFCISVPVGAWHPLLPDCLASLAAQAGPKQIALMDASDDPRVKAIADKYDGLFAYRRHGPDKGQSDAIIEGWENADGAVLGWLNADDILFPGAFRAVREVFANHHDADVVYGHSTIIDGEKRMKGYHWAVEPPGPRILEGGVISQPSCFFKRSAYDRTDGVNRDLHYTMDWDLWIQLYKTGAAFRFIDEALSMVMWADGTKTSSFDATRRRELKSIIDANAPTGAARKTMRSFAIHNAVEKLKPQALKRLAFKMLIRGRCEIFGLSGDGRLREPAQLFLAHFDDAPKLRLNIETSNARMIADVQVDGHTAPLQPITDNIVQIDCPNGVRSGETVTIRLAPRAGKHCYFISAAWAD